MAIACSLILSQECRLELLDLPITGGLTGGSIFPRVDELLEDTDCQQALAHVAVRKRPGNYHSMVDFLCVELFPQHRAGCQRFYRGDGPQLQFLMDAPTVARMERVMVSSLLVAKHHVDFKRRTTWARLREAAHRLEAKNL